MTPKYVLLLFCAFVVAMKDREPVHQFSSANTETWKRLAIEEERLLKDVDEKFNENFEKFDAEMKETLKSLNADLATIFKKLEVKCKTDVLDKTFQKYATTGISFDYEKIAMQAVQNYYKLMWYFILKRKHPEFNAKDYIFKIMWPFLAAEHRDFGSHHSVQYYKPPLMSRDENLKLYKRILSESFKKCDDLLQERFLNWAVHRYLTQNDGKKLKAISDSLAEALEDGERNVFVNEITLKNAKEDLVGAGGNYPFSEKLFYLELKTALKTFVQGLNVQVERIDIFNGFDSGVKIYLKY